MRETSQVLPDLRNEALQTSNAKGAGMRRFDPNPKLHNHFLCRGCGRVCDLPIELPALTTPRNIEGFWVETFTVDFYGFCPFATGRSDLRHCTLDSWRTRYA